MVATSRLATAANDGTIRLWEVPSGKPLKVLAGHTGRIRGLLSRRAKR